jgi:tetratricopeptide (TPR) repeat protein
MKRAMIEARRSSILKGLFFLGLLLLSACAGNLPSQIEKGAIAVSTSEVVETVVTLSEGRRGFIINEAHELSAEEEAVFQEAILLLENDDAEKAITLLEPLVANSTAVTAPYINLAKAYQQTEQMDKAEEVLQQALVLIPGHPLASHEYGLLLRKAGRFSEARGIYETALGIFPDYLPIRKNLGILCDLYLNDSECSLEQFQFYHEAQPDDQKVKLWISEIKLR